MRTFLKKSSTFQLSATYSNTIITCSQQQLYFIVYHYIKQILLLCIHPRCILLFWRSIFQPGLIYH